MEISLPSNTKLQTKYTVRHSLGEGGFGITYFAEFLNPEQKVAIKEFFISGCVREGGRTVILTKKVKSEEYELAKRKFREEALALSKLNHRGIVNIRDIFDENNTVYYVMEFIEKPKEFIKVGELENGPMGMTMKELIRETNGMEEEEVLYLGIQLAEALEVIHNAKILHLDVKPENVMVSGEKIIVRCSNGFEKKQYKLVLIDFGTAKITDSEASNKTLNRFAFYSKYYSAPELYSGVHWLMNTRKKGEDAIDPFKRLDVYSLGATLYHALTNKNPEEQHRGNELTSPKTLVPRISQQTNALLLKALAFKPQDRFQDIGKMKEALEKVIQEVDPTRMMEVENPLVDTIPDSSPFNTTSFFVKAFRRIWEWRKSVGIILSLLIAIFMLSKIKTPPLDCISKEEVKIIEVLTYGAELKKSIAEISKFQSKCPENEWLIKYGSFCQLMLKGESLRKEAYNLKRANKLIDAKKKYKEARSKYKEAKEMKVPYNRDIDEIIKEILIEGI